MASGSSRCFWRDCGFVAEGVGQRARRELSPDLHFSIRGGKREREGERKGRGQEQIDARPRHRTFEKWRVTRSGSFFFILVVKSSKTQKKREPLFSFRSSRLPNRARLCSVYSSLLRECSSIRGRRVEEGKEAAAEAAPRARSPDRARRRLVFLLLSSPHRRPLVRRAIFSVVIRCSLRIRVESQNSLALKL